MNVAMSTTRTVHPTGRQFCIEAAGYRAVLTEVGAGLRRLEVDSPQGWRPLVVGHGVHEAAHTAAGQVMAPWPNRVAGGRYRFDGADQQLDVSESARGTAIHGLVRWSAWQVAEQAADKLRFTHRLYPHPGYPHILDLAAEYSLSDAGLEVVVCAHNRGANTAPYGFAAHPYLTPGVLPTPGGIDRWTLQLPAERRVIVDERLIPTGIEDVDGSAYDFRTPRVLDTTSLDTAFCGVQREMDGMSRVRLSEPGGGAVALWMDRGLNWIQVFTADPLPDGWRRAGVAIEPMTCPPDAFNSGMDLICLASDETVVHRWGIQAGEPI